VLKRHVDTDRRIGRARSARDEANARTAGLFAVSRRHERRAAFVARNDQLDAIARAVQRVEHGQVRLARHAKPVSHAVYLQLIDEDFPARSWLDVRWHKRRLYGDPHAFAEP